MWLVKLLAETIRSLPSRERGLKSGLGAASKPPGWSLPSRERGLKFDHVESPGDHVLSLPSRERGLKLLFVTLDYQWYACRSLHGSVD